MNVKNGEILGTPAATFDPSVFTKPVIPQSTYDQLQSDNHGRLRFPTGRAQAFIDGSTFKPITAVAALEERRPDAHDSRRGTAACSRLAAAELRERRTTPSYGSLQLPQALQVSSDVFFSDIGADLYYHDQETGSDDTQQHWASELGIGRSDWDRPARSDTAAGSLLRSGATSSTRTTRPTDRGRSETMSTSQSARATCRPIRCRWPSPTRRSPRRRRGPSARWHWRSVDASGRAVQEIDPAPQRHSRDRSPDTGQGDPRGNPHGSPIAWGNVLLGVRELPHPDGGQDGDGGASRPGRPVLVRGAGSLPQPADRGRRDDRTGRLRRRGRGPGRCRRSSPPTSTSTSARPRRLEPRSRRTDRSRSGVSGCTARSVRSDGQRRLPTPARGRRERPAEAERGGVLGARPAARCSPLSG